MAVKASAAATGARGAGSRSPQNRFRPISQSFSTQFRPPAPQPLTPNEAYKKLELENLELKEDVESLTMMVERLRSDAERLRIRQAHAAELSRKKSFRASAAFLQSPNTPAGGGIKGTPSPAAISALDLTPPVAPSAREDGR